MNQKENTDELETLTIDKHTLREQHFAHKFGTQVKGLHIHEDTDGNKRLTYSEASDAPRIRDPDAIPADRIVYAYIPDDAQSPHDVEFEQSAYADEPDFADTVEIDGETYDLEIYGY